MFYISKKELASYPLDQLFEYVYEKMLKTKSQLEQDAATLFYAEKEKVIKMQYANREDSFEGSLEDIFPFPGVDPKLLADEVQKTKKDAVKLALEKFETKNNSAWLLPQIYAYIAKMPISRNSEGLVDSKAFFTNFEKDNWHKGLYYLLTHPSRGDLVPKQYTAEGRNYSALVPLILAPFKRFDNIKYSEWSKDGLNKLVDSALWDAMNTSLEQELSKEEILAARDHGLLIKSGKGEGSKRNPSSTHKLYGLGSPYNKMPWIAQAMLFQIWCAHPSNRSPLAVLDWKDWDGIPEDLISTDVVLPETKKIVPKYSSQELDWIG